MCYSYRHRRKCVIPLVRKCKYNYAMQSSLKMQGPRLFNCLPKNIRNLAGCRKEKFNLTELDSFLATIPDEPLIPGYTQWRRTETNSLPDVIYFKQRVGLYELDINIK